MTPIRNKIVSTLALLAHWLDTDIYYLLKGGGWTLLAQGVGAATSLATAWGFAHFLPQDSYGTYKYILSVAALLAIPTLSGMNMAVLQAVARGEDGTAIKAILMRIRWGTLAAIAGIVIGAYYLFFGNATLGYSFIAVGIATPLVESISTAQSILTGKRRFDIASRQSMIASLINAGVVIGAILITKDPFWIIVAYFASVLAGRAITLAVSRQFIQNDIVSKEALAFGMHASAAGILGIIAANADILLLWHSAGAETLALYAFALAAVTPFQTFVKSILNLAQPKFASQDKTMLALTTPRRVKQAYLFLLPAVGIAILALPPLFHILFPAYEKAVPFAQILTLSVLFYSEKLYGIAVMATQKARALYTINIINAVLQIVMLAVFIPLFGGWGAVAATLLQQIFASAITRFYFYRLIKN